MTLTTAPNSQVTQLRNIIGYFRARAYHDEGAAYIMLYNAYVFECVSMGLPEPRPPVNKRSMDLLFDRLLLIVDEIEVLASTGHYDAATRRTFEASQLYRSRTESYWGHMHSDFTEFLQKFRFQAPL